MVFVIFFFDLAEGFYAGTFTNLYFRCATYQSTMSLPVNY